MASHRLILTTLAAAAALTATGCGSGKDTDAFLPTDPPVSAAPSVPPAAAAPVIVGGPSEEIVAERDLAATQAAGAITAAQEADERRKEASRELREEREKAERARERHQARQERLRKALAEARKDEGADAARPAARPAPAAPKPQATIGASDVGRDLTDERNARSDAEARAAVIRFHELLDRRDAGSCELLTQVALDALYGTEPGAIDRCRAMVGALSEAVSVTIEASRADRDRALLDIVVHYGETDLPQTMALVLVDGTWKIAAAARRDR